VVVNDIQLRGGTDAQLGVRLSIGLRTRSTVQMLGPSPVL
jgi:hypothetical protein